jgi:cyclophilin family peptidyl-prolyl cis-trans isomerase
VSLLCAAMFLPRTCAAGAVLAVSLALAACGGDDGSSDSSTSFALPPGCADVREPAPKKVNLKAPKKELPAGSHVTATVDTSCGAFKIDLDTKASPKTTSSFAYLADKGVYDDTTFHRVVPGFVIQGGDPLGNGEGGPGYFVDEPPPPTTRYTQGTVAMVKGQVEPPGRSGSQFFVVIAADAGLQPDYALLGHVSAGEDVVQKIAKFGDPSTGDKGTPLAPVVIDKVTISGK